MKRNAMKGAALLVALSLAAVPQMALAEETPAPEATPVPISEEVAPVAETPAVDAEGAPTAPLPAPKTNTFAFGQSMQIRVNADAEPNSALANFRWSVGQLTVQAPPDTNETVTVPVPDQGTMTRYLNSLGRPTVTDGVAELEVPVSDGFGLSRTVSLAPGDFQPPISLTAEFTLDGEPITAKELVGKSGVVTAKYTLRNLTGAPTDVTVKDLAGNDVVQTVNAETPFIGIAQTLLPQRYTGLNTGSGQFGADGRANNQVQWIALPFAPLSRTSSSSFGWAANVTDAVIPSMLIQLAPVYLPPGHGGGAAPGVGAATGSGGELPVNLNPAVTELQAGVASIIAGVETLTAGGGTDPLQTVEERLNSFFQSFGTNLQNVSSLLDPNNPESVTALLGQAVPILQQITDPLVAVDENWETIERVVGLIASQPSGLVFAGLLNGLGVPDIPPFGNGDGTWTTAEANALIAFARDLQPQLDRIGGQLSVVAPLLQTLTPLMASLLASITELSSQIAVISQGLQAQNVDLPALDAVISSAVASILASPGGQQLTGGLDQVSTGLGLARAELSAFLADVITQVRGLAGSGNEAIVALRASIAGLAAGAARSPLVYGAPDPNAPPDTVLAGAYEFRIDAADSNIPNTLPRILLGLVALIAAGLLGFFIKKRNDDAVLAGVPAGAGAGAAAAPDDDMSATQQIPVAPVANPSWDGVPDAQRPRLSDEELFRQVGITPPVTPSASAASAAEPVLDEPGPLDPPTDEQRP